jgi:hypothetical protein
VCLPIARSLVQPASLLITPPLLAEDTCPAVATQYLGGEPCSICGHKLEVPAGVAGTAPALKPPSAFPSEIVPGFLYLGSYDHASRQEILKTLGINYILSVGAAGGPGARCNWR